MLNKYNILFLCLIIITNFYSTNHTISSISNTSNSASKSSITNNSYIKSGQDSNLKTQINNNLFSAKALNLISLSTNSLENIDSLDVVDTVDTEDQKCIEDYHAPFGSTETIDMKSTSIICYSVVIFTLLFLLLLFEIIRKNTNKFIKFCFNSLVQEGTYLLISLFLLILLYLLKALDTIKVNWQIIITAFLVFIFAWLVVSSIIVFLSYLVVLKWKDLETTAKSFKHTQVKYEKNCKSTPHEENNNTRNTNNISNNNNLNSSSNSNNAAYYYELFEFLILKTYFIVPFFPVFKPSILTSNFSMSRYLKFAMQEKLSMLFKISYTTLILTLIIVLIWNVTLAEMTYSNNTRLIITMLYPIIGIIVVITIYSYLKIVYRRSVIKVTDDNYTEFKDLDEFNQNYASERFLNYPVYIESIINNPEAAKVSQVNFHYHVHGRTSSYYEDTIVFGASGYYIIFNIFQTVVVVFVVWLTYTSLVVVPLLFNSDNNSNINNKAYSTAVKIICICSLAVYTIIYCYLVTVTIKWYTVISSIEMKRNDECIKDSIKEELEELTEESESLFRSFKRLYYDMKIKNKSVKSKSVNYNDERFNHLNKPTLQKILMTILLRYKGITTKEELQLLTYAKDINSNEREGLVNNQNNYSKETKLYKELSIDVYNDLKLFLKTSGNTLTNEDVDYMLHMIEHFDKYKENNSISQSQLFEIWAVMIHFSTKKQEEIVYFVFQQYYKERVELLNTNRMSEEGVQEFLRWYQEYFTVSNIEFIEKCCKLVFKKSKEISVEMLVGILFSLRRHYRN